MKIVPISLKVANAYIDAHHRHHHGKKNGYRFAVGLADDAGGLIGVAIASNPASRSQADGLTLEVSRTCTAGEKNANSMLYGAIRRVAIAMGYRRLITYTMPEESGASLRAVGWVITGETRGESWNRPGRARVDLHQVGPKVRWEYIAA